jgi:hypothetical protein
LIGFFALLNISKHILEDCAEILVLKDRMEPSI